jgi:ATP-binding cassette subfamily D (ALD) protein 3
LKGFTFYQISNLDNRITNADQLLTDDVKKFVNGLTECYSNTAKPILDVAIYSSLLTSSIGAQGPGLMLLYLVFS